MARTSKKVNKSLYQLRREELGLSREKASELLESMTPERIERIENGKLEARPDEILLMAEKYKDPHLCNHYCANDCAIGIRNVPEIKTRDLSQIVLEMLASLNSLKKEQERLIEITVDGKIETDEIEDFIKIQEELEQISMTVEALKLWSKEKLTSGQIDMEAYKAAKEKTNKR